MRSRIVWWLAAAAVLLLYTWGIASVPLFEPDEGRYAEIPREMLARGDFVTPRLDGVLYFEKPVLYYWLTAGALLTLGHTELACRIWNALLGLAGLALAFLLGRSIGGNRASGLMAALVLATAPVYFAFSRVNSIDMLVSFLIGACLTAFWFAQRTENRRRRKLLWYLVALAAALAVLAKGLIGLLIPGAVAFLYILVTRRWKLVPDFPWLGGTALFLLVAAPWHILAALRNPDFLWFYFVHEHFLRYLTPEAHRSAPWWLFLAVILVGMAPWSGALAGIARGRRALRARSQYEGVVFLIVWTGFVVVFFSLSHSKLIPYVLPAFLPAAVLAALALSLAHQGFGGAWAERGTAITCLLPVLLLAAGWLFLAGRLGAHTVGRPIPQAAFGWYRLFAAAGVVALLSAAATLWRRRTLAGTVAAGVGAAFALAAILSVVPWAAMTHSSRDIATLLESLDPGAAPVFSYAAYPQSLPFYLGHRIGVIDYRGELAFGIDHLSASQRQRWFPTATELASRWSGARRMFLVVEKHDLSRLRAARLVPLNELGKRGSWVLFSNRPESGTPAPAPPKP